MVAIRPLLQAVSAARVIGDDAGSFAFIDRGHSTWTPDGVTLSVVVVYTARTERDLHDLSDRVVAARLPAGVDRDDAQIIPLTAEAAAAVVHRIKAAVPKWAEDPDAVRTSLQAFKGMHLQRRTGWLRKAWHTPVADDDADELPEVETDNLDADAVLAAAGTDDGGRAAVAVEAFRENLHAAEKGYSFIVPVLHITAACLSALLGRPCAEVEDDRIIGNDEDKRAAVRDLSRRLQERLAFDHRAHVAGWSPEERHRHAARRREQQRAIACRAHTVTASAPTPQWEDFRTPERWRQAAGEVAT